MDMIPEKSKRESETYRYGHGNNTEGLFAFGNTCNDVTCEFVDETLKFELQDFNTCKPFIVGVHGGPKYTSHTCIPGNKSMNKSIQNTPNGNTENCTSAFCPTNGGVVVELCTSTLLDKGVCRAEDASKLNRGPGASSVQNPTNGNIENINSALHQTAMDAELESCTRTLLGNDTCCDNESCLRTLLTKEDRSSCQSLDKQSRNSDLFGEYDCSICFELMLEPTTLHCGHTYCRGCVAKYYKKQGKTECPICRTHWSVVPEVNVALKTEIQKRFYPSYHQRLMRQSHGELESIKYLDSKNASPTVKKTEVNFLAFSPTQWGPNKSVRLCLAVMAVLMVIVVLGMWFALP